MPPRRQTTVYDVSSLRVHPDGTRVDQTENNRRLDRHKGAARDAHGNWIAQDAGGNERVKQRVRTRDVSEEEEEEEEEDKRQPKSSRRAAKRQKFTQDYSFLDALELPNVSHSGGDDKSDSLPTPSSELLKCIHYNASSYYAERGLLLNVSKKFRAARKQRRLERLAEGVEELSESSENDDDEDDDSSQSEGDVEHDKTVRKHRRKFAPGDEPHERTNDMYRVMDGSALMAMGILIQEYVAHLATPRKPVGWDEEDASGARELADEEDAEEE